VNEYLADMRLRNLSDLTINLYAGFLRRLERELTDGEGPLKLSEVTPELARAYLTSRVQQEVIYSDHPLHPEETHRLSPHTVHREVRTLRAFGSWLAAQGLENPFQELKLPKLPRPLVEVLTSDEIEKIFSVHNPETHFGARWQALFAFALDTGVRIAELIGMQAADMEIDRFRARVWAKGAKERYVTFGNRSQNLLLRFDTLFRDPECPAFFQTL